MDTEQTKRRPVILIGGGGHCKSVIDAAESARYPDSEPVFKIVGILDTADKVGTDVLGYPVIGTDDDIPALIGSMPGVHFVITVGHIKTARIRQAIAARVVEAGGRFATIVASTAHVSRHAVLGEGSVVLHGAMVNAGAEVGKQCIVNTLANIEHDARVGDFCHISTGAMVNGDCAVAGGVFLGSQSVMLNGARIDGEGSIVAAASFVRKTITIPGIYAGNPAILMKRL
ncbi:NeuD/PglB/VioB family sugar acetyltransferase [uncultured Rikenella sp.]|uniref:NeuD/PglB/VioB family sugar acetyltransferase n=1 Tax=uncultured Rikenella sp. TaxID=368003 RepID=UPI002619EB14|nr:NeuD/PglB/VioB family sugar acetyltransferase [uncultured Rikenella sp.]